MRRREFLGLLGGSALARPLAARAEQPSKTIGFLGAASATAWAPMVSGFEARLRELGWIDGRNVTIVYRWAEADRDRFAKIAAEFVQMKVDVIVTAGSAVATVMRTTDTIPIVLAAAIDPVDSGFVKKSRPPGGKRYRPIAAIERHRQQTA